MTLVNSRRIVSPERGFLFIFSGGVVCLSMLVAGCASTPSNATRAVGANPIQDNVVLNSGAASTELAVAQRMIRSGEYSLAIPRLMQVLSKNPESLSGIEARYFLGLTYYKIGGYRDALNYFNEYLAKSPGGQYSDMTREYIAKLEDQAAKTKAAKEELQAKIAEAQQKAGSESQQFARQLELANLYWKNAQYLEAGEVYRKILQQWPQLASDAAIRERMELAPDGTYTVLTPTEVERRFAEKEPVVIYNTHSFRSGRFGSWQNSSLKDTTYNVTGVVANRSQGVLENVQVIVTIYGFGSMIYDTQTFTAGRLRPGEKRAFSVRFTNFDTIENVERYECVGTFQR
ncbi:MAG TPA: FxLYD domain-containing protein [Candidatus Hydrogenedentes bacterium]|nr:FxLYD domain-containing protein [Candidatus Hydrogenedentota bacterium]